MRYEVLWSDAAQADLARLLAASDAAAVVTAAQRADAVMSHCGTRAGESRDLGERIVVENPLTIWYEVFESEERIRVLQVRRHNA
jgi:plasmid stabilization system protein ParE